MKNRKHTIMIKLKMFIIMFTICLLVMKGDAFVETIDNTPITEDPDDGTSNKGKIKMPDEPELVDNWDEVMKNTTNCEDFLANTTFDPFKILDVDWKIWYIWNHQLSSSYNLKFSIPSKVLIDRFRVELDDEIKPKVQWDDAMLFMESTIDFSALLIKTDVDGQFRVIPSMAFEYFNLPELVFGLKVIEPPGYLALMNCKYRLCYALAPADKMPYYLTYDEEAKKIGFRGEFGHSHIAVTGAPTMPPDLDDPPELHDDDGEDMHLELLKQYNAEMEHRLL